MVGIAEVSYGLISLGWMRFHVVIPGLVPLLRAHGLDCKVLLKAWPFRKKPRNGMSRSSFGRAPNTQKYVLISYLVPQSRHCLCILSPAVGMHIYIYLFIYLYVYYKNIHIYIHVYYIYTHTLTSGPKVGIYVCTWSPLAWGLNLKIEFKAHVALLITAILEHSALSMQVSLYNHPEVYGIQVL